MNTEQSTSIEPSVANKDELSDDHQENSLATPLFTIKKWNAIAMWSWDVKSENCAICRVQVMGWLK